MTDASLSLPARAFDLPRSLSAEARKVLANAYANRKPAPFPSLDDPDAWISFVAEREALISPMVDAFVAAPGATSERLDMGGASVWLCSPDVRQEHRPKAIYQIHGGGWVFGRGSITHAITKLMAISTGCNVYGVDYRMPPEHPYPTPLDDCLAGYRAMLDRFAPADILIAGQSAGGNLAAALMLQIRDTGLPAPAALFLDTPAVDLTMASDSLYTNEGLDSAIGIADLQGGFLYAGRAALDHPYVSPIYGDLSTGFPPTYLRTGTRDLLLSDTVRFHTALRKAGVSADLYVVEGMPHGGFDGTTAATTEDQEARADLLRWISLHFNDNGSANAA
ncbi:MAG: alpha/beta hydrolase [Porphyrobacter sp.]|jgi:monoterpene epsilon-lactone hydrolase|nr:alpha/beta hydrolase [Porphyrobacter sp.]